MAVVLTTLAPIAVSGTPTAVFVAPFPQVAAVYISAVGGIVTVGDANTSATRGITVASGATLTIRESEQTISVEQLFVAGTGSAQVSFTKVVG
jgi:hypothetical protein